MLCPNCGEDNPLSRSHCVMCSTSLVLEQKDSPTPTKAAPHSTEVIGGWIGLGLSILAFQTAVPYIFSRPIGGGINWFEVACAAIAGAAGMTLGRKLARFFSQPRG
jgi:hypothetical protein